MWVWFQYGITCSWLLFLERHSNITSIAFNQMWHLLFIGRCIIDIHGLDVTNCLFFLWLKLIVTLQQLANLSLIHNTPVLKSVFQEYICVSIYATQLPFSWHTRRINFYSPAMEIYCDCLTSFPLLVTATQFSFGESPWTNFQLLWYEWGWSYQSFNHLNPKNRHRNNLGKPCPFWLSG